MNIFHDDLIDFTSFFGLDFLNFLAYYAIVLPAYTYIILLCKFFPGLEQGENDTSIYFFDTDFIEIVSCTLIGRNVRHSMYYVPSLGNSNTSYIRAI